MKKILAYLSILLIGNTHARESELLTTYQPLNGLGSGSIIIAPVTCHQWFASSAAGPVNFISAKNVPPTDNPEKATADLNLANVYGLHFSTSDLGSPQDPVTMTLDATHFRIAEAGHPKEDVVRASLECLRICAGSERFSKVPLTVKLPQKDSRWLEKIVDEFNRHDREKVFFTPK